MVCYDLVNLEIFNRLRKVLVNIMVLFDGYVKTADEQRIVAM